jgi:metallophosphoesterase superfamily enzyme
MGPAEPTTVQLSLNGATLIPDASGAPAWPDRRTVIIADLHLEKGSSFVRHGALLLP